MRRQEGAFGGQKYQVTQLLLLEELVQELKWMPSLGPNLKL